MGLSKSLDHNSFYWENIDKIELNYKMILTCSRISLQLNRTDEFFVYIQSHTRARKYEHHKFEL